MWRRRWRREGNRGRERVEKEEDCGQGMRSTAGRERTEEEEGEEEEEGRWRRKGLKEGRRRG